MLTSRKGSTAPVAIPVTTCQPVQSATKKNKITISRHDFNRTVEEVEREHKRAQLEQAGQEPCRNFMHGRCTFGDTCYRNHNVLRIGCKQYMRGNCRAESCSYGHGRNHLCPFFLEGNCAQNTRCKLVHAKPAVEVTSLKTTDIGQAILNKVAERTAEKADVEVPFSSKITHSSARTADRVVSVKVAPSKKELPMQLALDVFTYDHLRGDALVERIKGLTEDIPVDEFLDLMLQDQNREKLSLGWCSDAQFGAVVKYWAAKSEVHQIAILDGVLKYCSGEDFPSMLIKGVDRSYVELVFLWLRVNEVIQDSSFLNWADRTDGNDDDSKGKQKALVQLSSFLMILRENEIPDEEEEEDEVEDEHEETSQPVELHPVQAAVSAKEQTKAAKKERRAAKLATRGTITAC